MALPAAHVLSWGAFARGQKLRGVHVAVERCGLVAIRPHRCEALAHPDPTGCQHAALVALCVASATSPSLTAGERRAVPLLDRHGALQAAVLLSRLLTRERDEPSADPAPLREIRLPQAPLVLARDALLAGAGGPNA
jgi:hypothetical protein